MAAPRTPADILADAKNTLAWSIHNFEACDRDKDNVVTAREADLYFKRKIAEHPDVFYTSFQESEWAARLRQDAKDGRITTDEMEDRIDKQVIAHPDSYQIRGQETIWLRKTRDAENIVFGSGETLKLEEWNKTHKVNGQIRGIVNGISNKVMNALQDDTPAKKEDPATSINVYNSMAGNDGLVHREEARHRMLLGMNKDHRDLPIMEREAISQMYMNATFRNDEKLTPAEYKARWDNLDQKVIDVQIKTWELTHTAKETGKAKAEDKPAVEAPAETPEVRKAREAADKALEKETEGKKGGSIQDYSLNPIALNQLQRKATMDLPG